MRSFLLRKVNNFTKTLSLRAKVPNTYGARLYMIHQDCYNKYYTINLYEDHIEIEINFIPKGNFNKAKIYFDLAVYYSIDYTIIKYKGKIFHKEEELKKIFKCIK